MVMKTGSLWIIRLALTVQFLGVLAVPVLVATADSPRGVWMAEWLNPKQEPAQSEWLTSRSEARRESNGRTIGVLRLRDSKLSFVEQIGQVDWELDLASVRRIATTPSGRALRIQSVTGDEYIVAIMDPDFNPGSPKRAASTIERAIDTVMGAR